LNSKERYARFTERVNTEDSRKTPKDKTIAKLKAENERLSDMLKVLQAKIERLEK
jgi:hypothetical protein